MRSMPRSRSPLHLRVMYRCPVDATARIVSGKWTIVLLRDLASGPRRFSELERSLDGISTRTLSVRLKALCDAGIIVRRDGAEGPLGGAYALTDQGKYLLPVLHAMRDYGTRFLVGAPAELARAPGP